MPGREYYGCTRAVQETFFFLKKHKHNRLRPQGLSGPLTRALIFALVNPASFLHSFPASLISIPAVRFPQPLIPSSLLFRRQPRSCSPTVSSHPLPPVFLNPGQLWPTGACTRHKHKHVPDINLTLQTYFKKHVLASQETGAL